MSHLHFSLRCFLFGHDDLVRRSPDRLYLQCRDCGRETPGWPLSARAGADRSEAHDGAAVPSTAPLMEPLRH